MTRALIACLCLLLLCASASAQANNRPVTIDEVIQLTQSGISDETIITFLETREIRFVLSPQDIVRLRAAGISEELIRYLLHSATEQAANRSVRRHVGDAILVQPVRDDRKPN